jgi:hypothetical protein
MSKNEDLSVYTEIKLNIEETLKEVIGEKVEFPKYTTQIINLANQNSGGTRPAVVGKLSDLIKQCPYKTHEGWKKWYLEKYPDAIEKATQKVSPMISNLKKAINEIDDDLIEKWIEDLVITKTAEGLIIQEIILETISKQLNKEYRSSTAVEESQNIDGYIGNIPVQIKPESYMSKKPTVREDIDSEIIYYKKTEKYLYIYTKLVKDS